MLFILTLIIYLSSFLSAQQSGVYADCNTYGLIFSNPGDTNGCEYNIVTDDGILLNPVEFKPPLPIDDSMYIHFSYEYTNNYSCQGEPVIIHCFEVVDSFKFCEAEIEIYRVDCDSLEEGIDCGENIYSFVAFTNPEATSLIWKINNKVVSLEESFVYNFTEPGDYSVKLETLTEDTCFATAVEHVYIGTDPSDSCWVDFTYKEIPENDSLIVYQFIPMVSDSIIDIAWYVDGELASVKPGFTFHFDETGSHEVCINVETISGCEVSNCNEIFINPCEINVDIKYYLADSLEEETNFPTYHIYGVLDVDQPVNWIWEIDGQIVSYNKAFEYTFTDKGYYPIEVSVLNENDCQGSDYDTIVVDSQPSYCQANFYYYNVSSEDSLNYFPSNGKTIQFINTSKGEDLIYTWDLGDGVITSEKNPLHTYSLPGVYNVSLLIQSKAFSCYDSIAMQVYVGSGSDCYADFYYYKIDSSDSISNSDSILSMANTYQFIHTSDGIDLSYNWYFDDGITSTEANPVHTFNHPGVYNVILFVESSTTNCSDSIIKQVVVDSVLNCNAYFEYCIYNEITKDSNYIDSSMSAQEKMIVGFKNLSTPDNYISYWNFGDGTYSQEKNPVHRYQKSGVYEVCLKIYNSYGCSAIYCESIKVGILDCEVDFTYDIIVPSCEGFNVAYDFKPITSGQAVSYLWSFGDGETSFVDDPIHMYEHYGSYEICVQAYFYDGCTANKCKSINFGQDDIDSTFIRKCSVTPVIDLEQSEHVSLKELYPVPAQSTLTLIIESDKEQQVQIELIDLLGKNYKLYSNQWLSAGENHIELDLNGLKTGNYIYMMTSDSGVARGQIIIVE